MTTVGDQSIKWLSVKILKTVLDTDIWVHTLTIAQTLTETDAVVIHRSMTNMPSYETVNGGVRTLSVQGEHFFSATVPRITSPSHPAQSESKKWRIRPLKSCNMKVVKGGGSYLFDAYRGRSWQGYAFFGEKLSVRIYSMAVDHFLIEKKKSLRLTWDNVFAFQSLQVLRTCSKNSYPTKYILKSYSMVRTFFNGSIGWKRCLIFVRPIKFCNISHSVSEKGTLSECRKRMYMNIFIRSNRL